jgi:NTP pyrophosphatase (non-canonical NTP hydrolase)
MKTIKEWFLELPEGVKQKALSNLNQEVKDLKVTSFRTALARGFSWKDAPEGLLYWESVGINSGAPLPTPIETLIPSIEAWANARGITSPQSQLLKFFEEGGELASALLKNKEEEEKDAVGDVLVTLIIYCKLRNINLAECLSLAWEQIKNRTGKTQGGIFVKDETSSTTPTS